MSDRLNDEGVPRSQLKLALQNVRVVQTARRINACLLCRDRDVNESGLCGKCWSQLTDDEFALAQKWLQGTP